MTTEQQPRPRAAVRVHDQEARLSVLLALQELRETAGLSRPEVARRMGVGVQALAQLEDEGTDVSLSTLQRYARAVGCSIRVEFRPEQPDTGGGADA